MPSYKDGKFLQTLKASAWLSDGIMVVRAKDNVFLDLEDAKEITALFAELTDTPVPLMVDFHTLRGQTGDCRKYFSRDEEHSRLVTATALMIDSPVSRALSFFFVTVARPIRPTQFFTDEAKAINWLNQYRVSLALQR